MDLLSELKKFYRNEQSGLGHYQEDLFAVAWALAEKLEWSGIDSNAWKAFGEWADYDDDEEAFEAFIADLRNTPTVTKIDQTVNMMHQGLLDAIDHSGETGDEMMYTSEGDIVEYLLNRE